MSEEVKKEEAATTPEQPATPETANVPATQPVTGGELMGPANANLPDFLQNTEVEGVDLLSQYVRPPMLRVVQPLTKAPLIDLANIGDVCSVPQNLILYPADLNEHGKSTGERSEPFYFTPIFFFPEFIEWNPVGTKPAIRERTINPRSNLARMCKDSKHWEAPLPGNPDKKIRRQEHLNFLVMLENAPEGLSDIPVCISFARSGYKHGEKLASLIKLRRAAICAGRYAAYIRKETNDQGTWYSIQVDNPPGNDPATRFVPSRERYEYLVSLHREYAKYYQENLLSLNYEDEDGGETGYVDEYEHVNNPEGQPDETTSEF